MASSIIEDIVQNDPPNMPTTTADGQPGTQFPVHFMLDQEQHELHHNNNQRREEEILFTACELEEEENDLTMKPPATVSDGRRNSDPAMNSPVAVHDVCKKVSKEDNSAMKSPAAHQSNTNYQHDCSIVTNNTCPDAIQENIPAKKTCPTSISKRE